MQVPTKPWYKSKTFWLGILQLTSGSTELIIEYLESPELGIGMVISGILTLIFRYVTKQPITLTGKNTKYIEESRMLR